MSISFKEAEEILATAHEKAATYTGPCSECRWRHGGFVATCGNPLVLVHAFSLDDPNDAKYVVWCDEQRSASSLWGKAICGPEGSLFEAGLWRRFRDWLTGQRG